MTQTEDPIRHHSNLLLHIIKDKAGIDLDYSILSLLYLDKVLEQLFGKEMSRIPKEGMEDFRNSLKLQIACFYGECIRQTFSGVWEQDEKLGLCLNKIGNQDVTILPLSTAEERMTGDDTKIFTATQFVCSEVFKHTHQSIYTEN